MGYQNLTVVMASWTHLGHAEYRLLMHMAWVSLDPPGNPMLGYAPCLYWAGTATQAMGLGYDPAGKDVCRAVRRVRAGLVSAGVITPERVSARGRSTTWHLRLYPDARTEVS